MRAIDFVYKELPGTKGSIDKALKITPNEICTLIEKYHQSKIQNIENELGDSLPSIPETEKPCSVNHLKYYTQGKLLCPECFDEL